MIEIVMGGATGESPTTTIRGGVTAAMTAEDTEETTAITRGIPEGTIAITLGTLGAIAVSMTGARHLHHTVGETSVEIENATPRLILSFSVL